VGAISLQASAEVPIKNSLSLSRFLSLSLAVWREYREKIKRKIGRSGYRRDRSGRVKRHSGSPWRRE
jgi:hypothetical protein